MSPYPLLLRRAAVVALAGFLAPASAWATSFGIDTVLSGSSPSSPSTPWLTSSFYDVRPGMVGIDLSAANLGDGERVSRWYFNLDPSLNAKKLRFFAIDGTRAKKAKGKTNRFGERGTGKFDARMKWNKKRGLGEGGLARYEVICRGCSGFDASSFGFATGDSLLTLTRYAGPGKKSKGLLTGDWLPGGTGGPAGAGGSGGPIIPGTTSGSGPNAPLVPTPWPSSLVLLGSGLTMLGFVRSRFGRG